jgi:hypothetical protein
VAFASAPKRAIAFFKSSAPGKMSSFYADRENPFANPFDGSQVLRIIAKICVNRERYFSGMAQIASSTQGLKEPPANRSP